MVIRGHTANVIGCNSCVGSNPISSANASASIGEVSGLQHRGFGLEGSSPSARAIYVIGNGLPIHGYNRGTRFDSLVVYKWSDA